MKRFLVVVSIIGMVLSLPGVSLGQDVIEWPGHMFMRPMNPTIRFNGTLIFRNKTNTNEVFLFGSATAATPQLSVHNQQVGEARLTNCGTTPSIAARSNNVVGQVTTGSGAGGANCTVVFAVPFASAPTCVLSNTTAARTVFVQYANATAISFQGQTAGDVVNYMCIESR